MLGDSAYPLEINLMVPFKDNGFLSAEQKKFNSILSSTRVFVEQAFGILKKKFRILNYIEIQNLRFAKIIIMVCVILHNIIIENESCVFTEITCDTEQETSLLPSETNVNDDAKNKRERLKSLFSA